MIKLELDEYGGNPGLTYILEDNGLIVAERLHLEGRPLTEPTEQVYSIGYICLDSGGIQTKVISSSYSPTPEIDLHTILASAKDGITIFPHKITSLERYSDRTKYLSLAPETKSA